MGKRERSYDSDDSRKHKRHRHHHSHSRKSSHRRHSSHSRSRSHSYDRKPNKSIKNDKNIIKTEIINKDSVNKVLESKSGKKTFLPAPLILDDDGNEIDANGNVIKNKIIRPAPTLKINQKVNTKVVNPYLIQPKEKDIAPSVVDYRIHTKIRDAKKDRGLKFREEGSFVKKAESMRAKEARLLISEIQKKQLMEISDDTTVDIITTNDDYVPSIFLLYFRYGMVGWCIFRKR